MKTSARVLLLALGLVGVSLAAALELPDPPPGFSWKQIPELKAAFLMPDGWYFKSEEQKGTLAYFITAENIDTGGRFDTGLTINVKPHLGGRDAVQYAKAYISQMGQQNELIRQWETEAGLLHGFGCVTRVPADETGPAIVMHNLAIGNSKTNTLYVFFFESPESEWERAWKTGEKMMTLLVLDDEI